MNLFADSLKKFRIQKGFSQDDLAKKVSVHPKHISRYERGLSLPSVEIASKIAQELDISIDMLVLGDNANSLEDMELFNLFKKVQTMEKKQKDSIKDFISIFILKYNLQQQLAY